MNSFELTCEIAKILDSKKGEDIKAIRVQELTSIGDYFVIASGANVPQVKAMSDEVWKKNSPRWGWNRSALKVIRQPPGFCWIITM